MIVPDVDVRHIRVAPAVLQLRLGAFREALIAITNVTGRPEARDVHFAIWVNLDLRSNGFMVMASNVCRIPERQC